MLFCVVITSCGGVNLYDGYSVGPSPSGLSFIKQSEFHTLTNFAQQAAALKADNRTKFTTVLFQE